jgi:MoaA/NifB/PqqE/SkfB family radical SAM enzyme
MPVILFFSLLLVLYLAVKTARFLARDGIQRRLAQNRTYTRPIRFYLNWAHANLEMRLRVRKVRSRPLEITLDPSNICQLACPVCITGTRQHDRPAGSARQELVARLLDEDGAYLFTVNFFNWGEPFLQSKLLFPWVAAASAKGIRTRVSSNMSLVLSDQQIEQICASGLHTLVVSLDGATRETYSKYRINGDFDRVMKNLERVIAEKKRRHGDGPRIIWQFLVFAHNEHQIDLARTLANKMGVDEIWFSPPQVNENVGIFPARDPRYQNGLSRLHGQLQPSENRDACAWHYMMTAINWDGTLSPCCVLYKTADDFGSIGTSGQHPLMDAYNSPSYQSVRSGVTSRKPQDPELVCFHCPAPELQSAQGLNQDILYHCKLRILDRLNRAMRMGK